ncbi:MAG: alkyldihydroxyacetonephosphate synthase [Frankiales bacterium]|jgi:alkyldihydroxyacetonephosphate synthase|nr:alkyldihydroxyacetonephosphate synthase [Frankiales bacterium]
MTTYSIWGWGTADKEPKPADLAASAPEIERLLGFPGQEPEVPAPLATLPAPRVVMPSALASLASNDPPDRARHGLGRSYRDLIRGIRGRPDHVPDLVVRPGSETEISAVLDWASDTRVAVVPFGGGTSVVGGVTPAVGDDYAGSVSLDLTQLRGVVEVDLTSRAARVRAGTPGPQLEGELHSHGLTARFYPQSFERSTVGGWIATRAAGHFSTRSTHIDDIVESVTAVTPQGRWESRRLPASGAGPSPDRMLLGSEGTLGVVTEAWLRVQPRPAHRWSATYAAPDLLTGARAVRALLHDGMQPAACRVVDARESAITGTLTSGEATLVLGFESVGGPVDADAARATELLTDLGLRCIETGTRESGGAGESWRSTFVAAPYLRESLVLLGVLVETFETAATWDRFESLVGSVTAATEAAVRDVCGGGVVTCRTTHAYVDGIAPYFTVFAPARRGSELAQWDTIKAAASDAILAAGGTITHHHAVGRDHRPWYDRQRPDPFAAAMTAAKQALDPRAVLNPGVLLSG